MVLEILSENAVHFFQFGRSDGGPDLAFGFAVVRVASMPPALILVPRPVRFSDAVVLLDASKQTLIGYFFVFGGLFGGGFEGVHVDVVVLEDLEGLVGWISLVLLLEEDAFSLEVVLEHGGVGFEVLWLHGFEGCHHFVITCGNCPFALNQVFSYRNIRFLAHLATSCIIKH